ncbi:MAG: C40 family peptidase [Treponema sp.]|nr:C40 family peptidase [Treponema sp.]
MKLFIFVFFMLFSVSFISCDKDMLAYIPVFNSEESIEEEFEDIDSQISSSELKKSVDGQFEVYKAQLIQLSKKLQDKTNEIASIASNYMSDFLKNTDSYELFQAGKRALDDTSAMLKNALSFLEKKLNDNSSDFSKSSPVTPIPNYEQPNKNTYKFDFSNVSLENISDIRQKFIDFSMTLRGVPYKYGGENPSTGLDCSAFVRYSSKNSVNISLPRTAHEIQRFVKEIDSSEREAGDLVFFKSYGKVDHVGIYLGRYQGTGALHGREIFINAASAGKRTGVVVSAMDEPYWRRHYYSSGRFLPAANDILEALKDGSI